VFENRVLRRVFGPKRDEVAGEWRNCITRNFVICTFANYNQNGQVEKDEMGRACSTNGGEEEHV
jgi:hypothetical protein